MVIPWPLLASLAIAGSAAALWTRQQGGKVGEVLDVVLSVALAAVITARVTSLVVDALLIGGLPPLRAMLSLGAGLPTGAAILGGVVAGWRTIRQHPSDVTRLAVQAAAIGLAAWGVASLLRGDAAGITASVPLGIPLPGTTEPRIPVALLEAAAMAAVWWSVWRGPAREWSPGRQAALLAASVGATVALGSLLRPTVPTVDADVAAVLAVVSLIVAVPLALGRNGQVARLAAPTGVVVGLGIIVVSLLSAPAGLPLDRGGLPPTLAGAIAAGAPDGTPPEWDAEDLADFVSAADGPVVVNFWASWCPPCHAEAPAVARAAQSTLDATFLGVLVDDSAASGQSFADRYGFEFPTVVDGGVAAALGSGGLPTTVVLRPDGQIAHREVGGLDAGSLAAAIDRARNP